MRTRSAPPTEEKNRVFKYLYNHIINDTMAQRVSDGRWLRWFLEKFYQGDIIGLIADYDNWRLSNSHFNGDMDEEMFVGIACLWNDGPLDDDWNE